MHLLNSESHFEYRFEEFASFKKKSNGRVNNLMLIAHSSF